MSTTDSFRWGILGLGRIARKFAADLQHVPGARLVSVASRDVGRAQLFAREYGAAYAAGSYAEIFEGPELDAVYIATPHNTHCELAMLCLRHKVGVLCEKPMGMNAAEVAAMVELARAERTFLMEALWTRFLPTTVRILELIESGSIGKVKGLKADFGFILHDGTPDRITNPTLGGGALLDIGIYPVFLAHLLLGPPQHLQAASQLGPGGIDLDTGILWQNAEGHIAHLHATLLSRMKTEAYLFGETGTIHWHSRWHEPSQFSILRHEMRPELFTFDVPSGGYHYEAIEVQDCMQQGRTESEKWSLDDSLSLHQSMDRIRQLAGIRYAGDQW